MKSHRAIVLVVMGLVLLSTSACQKSENNLTGKGIRKAIALAELNDGSMVRVDCLVEAAKRNVPPQQLCQVISKGDTQPVTSVMQALQMKGTKKKDCYYYCTGNCGWNDYYGQFNNMYYSYGNNIPAQSWNYQFGIPQSYYYQYMYNYSYGPQQYPQQQYYGGGYPGSGYCNMNAWYGGDFTRYGGCYNNVFFM